jgi:hypothetical protein
MAADFRAILRESNRNQRSTYITRHCQDYERVFPQAVGACCGSPIDATLAELPRRWLKEPLEAYARAASSLGANDGFLMQKNSSRFTWFNLKRRGQMLRIRAAAFRQLIGSPTRSRYSNTVRLNILRSWGDQTRIQPSAVLCKDRTPVRTITGPLDRRAVIDSGAHRRPAIARIFHIAAVLMLLSIPVCANAQTQAVAAEGNVRTFGERVMQAGGIRSGENRGCVATGNVLIPDRPETNYKITIKSRGTRLLHTELSTPRGMRNIIVNGVHGVLIREDGQRITLRGRNLMTQRLLHLPTMSFADTLADEQMEAAMSARTSPSAIRFTEKSIPPGIKASVRDAGTKLSIVYFADPNTNRINRVAFDAFSDAGSEDRESEEMRYSDYRQVDGIWVPFKQDFSIGGKTISVLTLSSIDCSTSVSDSEFVIQGEESSHE